MQIADNQAATNWLTSPIIPRCNCSIVAELTKKKHFAFSFRKKPFSLFVRAVASLSQFSQKPRTWKESLLGLFFRSMLRSCKSSDRWDIWSGMTSPIKGDTGQHWEMQCFTKFGSHKKGWILHNLGSHRKNVETHKSFCFSLQCCTYSPPPLLHSCNQQHNQRLTDFQHCLSFTYLCKSSTQIMGELLLGRIGKANIFFSPQVFFFSDSNSGKCEVQTLQSTSRCISTGLGRWRRSHLGHHFLGG